MLFPIEAIQRRYNCSVQCIQNVVRELSSSYVCKRCFEAVKKYLDLKRQYKNLSIEVNLINIANERVNDGAKRD